jgi:DnaJ-class molecular chaperone
MDYYSILGVSKSASPDEIKQAYRKKVKQYHPDQGGDAEHFKKINEAYDVLKDSSKREQYDHPGYRQNSYDSFHFDNFFNQAFNQRRQQARNRDIIVNINLHLKDVFEKKVEFIEYRLGNGNIETVTVDIPAGAKTGDTIKYQGLGDNVYNHLTRGDLYVKIHVREPKDWARDGVNVITKRSVNVFDILTGCVIVVETLNNKTVRLKIPQGTKPGTILSINGYGIPDIRTGKCGNLYVQIDTEIPKIFDQNVLDKITEVKKLIEEKQ